MTNSSVAPNLLSPVPVPQGSGGVNPANSTPLAPALLANPAASKSVQFDIIDPNRVKFKKLSPFHDKSFFLRIKDACKRFFRWVFGISTPFPIERAELAVMMQLYRSSDEALLDLTKSSKKKYNEFNLPFSFLLKQWGTFITRFDKVTHKDLKDKNHTKSYSALFKLGENIIECSKYQTTLEAIDAQPKKKQLSTFKSLREDVLKKLKGMEAGDVAFVPAGLHDGDTTRHLIAEFTKTRKGDYKVRVLTVPLKDKDGNSLESDIVIEQTLEMSDLDMTLTHLLGASVNWKGTLGPIRIVQEFFGKIKGIDFNDPKNKNMDILQAFDHIWQQQKGNPLQKVYGLWKSLRVFKVIQHLVNAIGFVNCIKIIFSSSFRANFDYKGAFDRFMNADPRFKTQLDHAKEIFHVDQMRNAYSDEKISEVFLKSVHNDLGDTLKLSYKLSVLEEIYHKSKKELSKYPDLRREFQNEVLNLYHAITKHQDNLELKPQIEALKKLVDKVQTLDSRANRLLPAAPSKQKDVNIHFRGIIEIKDPIIPLQQYQTVPPDEANNLTAAIPLLRKPADWKKSADVVKQLTEWCEGCQSLIDNEQYNYLDGALMWIFSALEENVNSIDFTKMSQSDKAAFSAAIRSFSVFLVINHKKMAREGVSASTLNHLLKAWDICNRIVVSEKSGAVKLNSDNIKEVFTHPHFDFGIYSQVWTDSKIFEKGFKSLNIDGSSKESFAKEVENEQVDTRTNPAKMKDSLEHDLTWLQLSIDTLTSLDEFSPVKNGPQVLDEEVRKRIVEGWVSDDGKYPKGISKEYKGSPKTFRQILDERHCFQGLAIDVTTELQLMQASPDNHTRLKNTMGVFSKIPGVFGDPVIGAHWQRVFMLNLFHQGELYKCLQTEPEYAIVFTDVLRSMLLDAESSGNIPATLFLMKIYRDSYKILRQFEKNATLSGELKVLISSDLDAIEKKLDTDLEQIVTWKVQADDELNQMAKGGALTNAVNNRWLIHHEYLYHLSRDDNLKLDDETLKDIFISNFIVDQSHPPITQIDVEVERSIAALTFRTHYEIETKLKKMSSKSKEIEEWLLPLLPPDAQDDQHDWICAYPLFTSDGYIFDLRKKILYIDGKVKRPIPSRIANSPLCEKVFGKQALFTFQANYRNLKRKIGKENDQDIFEYAERYSFTYNGDKYRIIEHPEQGVTIYKHCHVPDKQKECWFQLQDVGFLTPKDKIPATVKSGLTWVHHNQEYMLTQGKTEEDSFFIRLDKSLPSTWKQYAKENNSPVHLIRSIHSDNMGANKKQDERILNPWKSPNFKIFQALDDPEYILTQGKNGKVDQVRYSRLPLSYKWDASKKAWMNSKFSGYALSNSKIGDKLSLVQKKGTPEKALFTASFFDYQIVEHEILPPKMIVNRSEFILDQFKCYAKREEILPARLVVLEIDRQKGLKSQKASDYFYMAYLLFIQGKYAESLMYLNRANSLEVELDTDVAQMQEWFRNWDDSSKNATAVRLHLEAIVTLRKLMNKPTELQIKEEYQRMLDLRDVFDEYKKTESTLSSTLRLPESLQIVFPKRNKLDLLNIQEKLHKVISDNKNVKVTLELVADEPEELEESNDKIDELKAVLMSNGIQLEEAIALMQGDALSDEEVAKTDDERLELLLDIESNDGYNRLLSVLQEEIEELDKIIEKNDLSFKKKVITAPTQATNTPIFPKNLLDAVLDSSPSGNSKKWDSFVDKLKNAFTAKNADEEFREEKGLEYAEDIKVAIDKKDTIRQLKDFDLSLLRDQLQDGDKDQVGLKALEHQISTLKAKFIEVFQLEDIKTPDWEKFLEKIEERNETLDGLLDRARYCLAAEDFSELVEEGWLLEKDLDQFKLDLEDYLIKDSLRQQYVKALDKITRILEGADLNILGPQLVQILEQKRAYDVNKDPQRFELLAFEWESGFIATPAQIKNFRTMLTTENHYMQEALAGGKTEIIRNIISKALTKLGNDLIGVITHIPLYEMHHPKYERVAREAYGNKVLRFEYSRKTGTDVFTLTQYLHNLKKILVEKGRIDLTKRDLLSFHHAVILKWDQLQHSAISLGMKKIRKESDLQIQKELDVCNEILQLIQDRLKISSDEFDTISNCEEEHIFAKGKCSLDPTKIEVAVDIGKWILSEASLKDEKDLFQINRQSKIDEKAKLEFLYKVAQLVHAKIAPDLNEEMLMHYLIGPSYENHDAAVDDYDAKVVGEFFNDKVVSHAAKRKLGAFRKYLQEIIPGTLKKQGGVKFGRSADGWVVKPYESSDVCMENSEQSSEEETIWFTICNYLDTTLGGVKAAQINELVQTKQAEASKEVKKARRLDKIIEYQNTITAEDWKTNFKRPLQDIVPEQYKEIADQINKDANLWSMFLQQFVFLKYTSSPEKIPGNAHDLAEMVKEFFGSSGTSESAMTFPDKIMLVDDLVRQKGVNGSVLFTLMKTYKDGDIITSNNVIDTLGSEMKKGDALIDLAPAFPGLSGKDIAVKVTDKLKQNNVLSDDSSVRYIDRSNNAQFLGSDNALPAETTNILSQKDTRGQNIEMSDDSIGYLTIGLHTGLTDFFQAALRMRKLPERLLSDNNQGQKVRYLLEPAVAAKLGPNPGFEDLVLFLADNEIESLKQLHFKAEKQKIEALPRTTIFKALKEIDDYETRRIVWSPVIREIYIQLSQQPIDKVGLPSYMTPPLEVLQRMAELKADAIKNASNLFKGIMCDRADLSKESQTELDKFIKILDDIEAELREKAEGNNLPDKKYLPKAVPSRAHEMDMDTHQTVEQEQDQELQAQQQQQLQQQQMSISSQPVTDKWRKLNLDSMKPLEFCNFLYLVKQDGKDIDPSGLFQSLRASSPHFDMWTYYTLNAYPNFLKNENPWSQFDFDPKSGSATAKAGQILFPRFMLIVDKGFRTNKGVRKREFSPRVISVVGTPNDFANDIDAWARKHKNDPDFDIFIPNLRNDKLDGGRYEWPDDYDDKTVKEISSRLVQMKFLLGEIDLLNPPKDENSPIRHEYKAFQVWLAKLLKDGSLSADGLEKSFTMFLQAYRPSQIPQYQTSAVAQVFKDLQIYKAFQEWLEDESLPKKEADEFKAYLSNLFEDGDLDDTKIDELKERLSDLLLARSTTAEELEESFEQFLHGYKIPLSQYYQTSVIGQLFQDLKDLEEDD